MTDWQAPRTQFRSIAIVINPTAGRSRAGKAAPMIRKLLAASGVDVTFHYTRHKGDGEGLAARAIQDGHDLIVAMGGDGTLHEVTNAILNCGRADVTLGLIPFGTGNDFARAVGLFGQPQEACRVLLSGERRLIDVGRIEAKGLGRDRWFLVAAGVGLVADTAKTVNDGVRFLHGAPAYVYGVLKTLKSFRTMEIEIAVNGQMLNISQATLVSVSNVETTGGGLKIAPGAVPDDGWLDVCLAGPMSKATMLQQLPQVAVGRHVNHPQIFMLRATTVAIDTVEPCPLWIDGEVTGQTPAYFSIERARLPMMTAIRSD